MKKDRKPGRQKDFKRADEIRDMLRERGIILKDTPQGCTDSKRTALRTAKHIDYES